MSRRDRIVLAIGVAVVVIAAVVFVLMRGGGGPEVASAPTSSPGRVTLTPRATASATPSAAPQTLQVFEGKDPFQPLLRATPAPGGTASPSPGASGGPTTGQRVSLLDIFTREGVRYATVEASGQTYTVKQGDTFGGSYRVVSLSDRCGTFVFGDERFSLCVGQEVLK